MLVRNVASPACLLGGLFITVFATLAGPAQGATDKYRVIWRDDPATTMVIGWNQINGNSAAVHWGAEDHGQNARAYPDTAAPDVTQHYAGMHSNFVRLTGLEPDTAYYFVIKDSNSISRRMWFRTAPDQPQSFSFVAGGDTRTNAEPRRRGNIMIAKLRPLFVCHGGDYMGSGTDGEWQVWFDDWQLTISEDGRIYPIVPAHGNHENRDMAMVYRLFDMPRPEVYNAQNVGGDLLRLYTLNTEIDGDRMTWTAQRAWFEQDLITHRDHTWKITQYHRPMRAHTGWKAEGMAQIAAWSQLFYDYHVDLAIECDTHMVKRTYPLRPSYGDGSFESFIRDDENGTVFIGEGSWGAPVRAADDDKPWTMASDSFHQFKWIHVHEDHIDVRSVRFENVNEITPLTDDDPFAVPENLILWTPPSGAVLRLPFDPAHESFKGEGRWAEVLSPGAQWRYFDKGAHPGEGWTASDFDDQAWDAGAAPLGYGDDGEVTTLSFGDNPQEKYSAYYFRTTFEVEADLSALKAAVDLLADDGFVVYLNGTELGRHYMPNGEVRYSTLASGYVDNAERYVMVDIDPAMLVAGENTLAIEVHQNSATSSDLALNARVRVLLTPDEEP